MHLFKSLFNDVKKIHKSISTLLFMKKNYYTHSKKIYYKHSSEYFGNFWTTGKEYKNLLLLNHVGISKQSFTLVLTKITQHRTPTLRK